MWNPSAPLQLLYDLTSGQETRNPVPCSSHVFIRKIIRKHHRIPKREISGTKPDVRHARLVASTAAKKGHHVVGLCPLGDDAFMPTSHVTRFSELAVIPNHPHSHHLMASPCIARVLDVRFWMGIVLQICRSETTVWGAVVDASSFMEAPPHELFLGYNPFWKDLLPRIKRRTNLSAAILYYSRS